ncbi:MAG TPA: DUF2809 domain-containing protein [Acidobacteriaceae bacterium]|nr:DUF2809 domain-containing protein [Acidobacteriaceae bacterium]
MTPGNRPNSAGRRPRCAAIILLLIPVGLLCRFVPLGLPYIIVKYGGSFLWAATVYWCIAFMGAQSRPEVIALTAAVATTLVEFVKLIQSPGLGTFRNTFAGKVLLGRHFSYIDIAVYCCAILSSLLIDKRAIHFQSASKE